MVYAATRKAILKYPVLSSIPVEEDSPSAYFAALPSINLERTISFRVRTQPLVGNGEGEDQELDTILQDEHNRNFKDHAGEIPFWRLMILLSRDDPTAFTASFIYHHAIGDGVSGIIFHDFFRESLNNATSEADAVTSAMVTPGRDTQLLPPLEALHPLPLQPISVVPSAASELTEWTGGPIHAPCRSRWHSLYISSRVSWAFFEACKRENVSVTSALSSVVAGAMFDVLPTTAEALTCIIPVSLRPWLQLSQETTNRAFGTYFDATRILFTRSENDATAGFWSGAHQVAGTLNEYRKNVSPSGEPYTAVAAFKNIADVTAIFKSLPGNPRDAALELTNVGLFPSAVAVGDASEEAEPRAATWQVGKVLLSRSAVVSGAAVTVSVATGGNGSMTVGFSWQDGVVADDMVHQVSKKVAQCLEHGVSHE